MPFIHFALMPSIFIILSITLHYWLDQKEFNQYFKIFFLGLAFGFIIIFLNFILKSLYIHSAHFLTILLKSLFIDGILFSVLLAVSLYFIFDRVLGIQLTITWSLTSIMIFSYLLGAFSVINTVEILTDLYPDTLLFYFCYLPMILLVTLILGFGIPKFMDELDLLYKIIWAVFSIGIPIIIFAFFYIMKFYNNPLIYLINIPFIAAAVLFEIYDFKQFRI